MVPTHAIERGLTLHPLLFCTVEQTDEMVYLVQKLHVINKMPIFQLAIVGLFYFELLQFYYISNKW